jgi:hypothetical protein
VVTGSDFVCADLALCAVYLVEYTLISVMCGFRAFNQAIFWRLHEYLSLPSQALLSGIPYIFISSVLSHIVHGVACRPSLILEDSSCLTSRPSYACPAVAADCLSCRLLCSWIFTFVIVAWASIYYSVRHTRVTRASHADGRAMHSELSCSSQLISFVCGLLRCSHVVSERLGCPQYESIPAVSDSVHDR